MLARAVSEFFGRVIGAAPNRKAVPVYVMTPAYNPFSGGTRAMNLLAHKMLTLGYDAYATPEPKDGGAPPYKMRYLDDATRARHAADCTIRIAVYPEVVVGNPLGAEIVARYLLNRSGLLVPGAKAGYGEEDVFITFDPDHLPAGKAGVDLFMPLVDGRLYRLPTAPVRRSGAVALTHRQSSNDVMAAVPEWLGPVTVVSMSAPRSPSELADLYRGAAAMVAHERTTAVYEALCCGCPVLCVPSDVFQEATYQRRFEGAGLAWSPTRDSLARATGTVPRFIALYNRLEASFDRRIRAAFDPIVQRATEASRR